MYFSIKHERIEKMQIIIVGAGKLGFKLAESLSQKDNHVTILDIEARAIEKASDQLDVLTIKGNGMQLDILENMNTSKADLLIAATSSDESNILICSMAKRLGCKMVVARVRNPEYTRQLSFIKAEMGIDHIVTPELAMAKEIVKYLLKGHALHMEEFAKGKVTMLDIKIQSIPSFTGKKIRELQIPESILIAAIHREGNIIIPNGDVELNATDTLYLIGKKDSINGFCKSTGNLSSRKYIKKALILGGGKAGYFLAQKLIKNGVLVKIIEQDKARCKYLAEQIPEALVIYGDGSDVNLLAEENITEMDAMVSVTGYDEENLLLALLAKQYGVEKVVAKVSRPSFIPIIEKLGIDLAVNPIMITASEILRFIQGGRVVSLSLLLGGNAEVLEIIVNRDSKIVGKMLYELGLPKGIIIGAIEHEGKVIIPNGNSIIHPGDRVIVFCLESEVSTLERFMYPSKGGFLNEFWNNYKGVGKPASF